MPGERTQLWRVRKEMKVWVREMQLWTVTMKVMRKRWMWQGPKMMARELKSSGK